MFCSFFTSQRSPVCQLKYRWLWFVICLIKNNIFHIFSTFFDDRFRKDFCFFGFCFYDRCSIKLVKCAPLEISSQCSSRQTSNPGNWAGENWDWMSVKHKYELQHPALKNEVKAKVPKTAIPPFITNSCLYKNYTGASFYDSPVSLKLSRKNVCVLLEAASSC